MHSDLKDPCPDCPLSRGHIHYSSKEFDILRLVKKAKISKLGQRMQRMSEEMQANLADHFIPLTKISPLFYSS